MTWQTDLSVGFIAQTLLAAVCAFLVYRCTKYFFGKTTTRQPPKHGTFGRRLGYFEETLDLFSVECGGTGNICIAISLASKQSLPHDLVRDALVLLAKRQPMLRAVIRTTENDDKYFEIKDIDEVTTMIDLTTSDVKASNWQDIWFETTSKQRGNDLLWRVVILQEEFKSDSKDYANTLMFTLNHSCIDGVSCVKFCKQFLNNLNELANGTISGKQEISSLNLQPFVYDMVTSKRNWYSLLDCMLTYCGLRAILKIFMQRMFARLVKTKQHNAFYAQFPPRLEISGYAGPSRLNVKVFNEIETQNIVQACKANNCTVTGALTAAAHFAFCRLVQDGMTNDKDVKLQHEFAINAQRFCDPKPHEDYIGYFAYPFEEFYMKYMTATDVDFWKVAQDSTRQIQDFVRNEEFIIIQKLISETMKPRELLLESHGDGRELLIRLSNCNTISSIGAFNFGQNEQQQTYKLNECFINAVCHGFLGTFSHFNHTINGKMTWQIVSDMSRVQTGHAEKFADLCFWRFLEVASDSL